MMNSISLPRYTSTQKRLLNTLRLNRYSIECPLFDRSVTAYCAHSDDQMTVTGYSMSLFFECAGMQIAVSIDQDSVQSLLNAPLNPSDLPQIILQAQFLQVLNPTLSHLESYFPGEIELKKIDLNTSQQAHKSLPVNIPIKIQGLDTPCQWLFSFDESFAKALLNKNWPHNDIEKNQHRYLELPVPISLWIGSTDICLSDFQCLETQDLILFDNSYSQEKQLVIKTKGAGQYLATMNPDNTLSLLNALENTMSDIIDEPLVEETDTITQEAINELPVRMSFYMGETQITLEKLQSLDKGYLFDLGLDLSSAAIIKANGKTVGRGRLVDIDNRLGIQITEFNTMED